MTVITVTTMRTATTTAKMTADSMATTMMMVMTTITTTNLFKQFTLRTSEIIVEDMSRRTYRVDEGCLTPHDRMSVRRIIHRQAKVFPTT